MRDASVYLLIVAGALVAAVFVITAPAQEGGAA